MQSFVTFSWKTRKKRSEKVMQSQNDHLTNLEIWDPRGGCLVNLEGREEWWPHKLKYPSWGRGALELCTFFLAETSGSFFGQFGASFWSVLGDLQISPQFLVTFLRVLCVISTHKRIGSKNMRITRAVSLFLQFCEYFPVLGNQNQKNLQICCGGKFIKEALPLVI